MNNLNVTRLAKGENYLKSRSGKEQNEKWDRGSFGGS